MPVPPSGPKNAKLYIVGEAPGQTEVARGIPFCGPSGNILWQTLLTAGIRREDCRVYNVLEEQLPGNDWKHATPEQLACGKKRLFEDIRATKPNIVFALGNHVLREFINHSDIGSWRGSLLRHNELECDVLYSIHPAAILRMYDFLPLFMFDCQKAAKLSKTKDHPSQPYKLILQPTFSEVVSYIYDVLLKAREIAFDIETYVDVETGMSRMHCIGFSPSGESAICIPYTKQYWSVNDDFQRIHNLVQRVCESDIPKIAQNGQFDVAVLRESHSININRLVFDTMCGMHVAYPELPKSLATITSLFTDVPYYKWKRATTDSREFYEYNALDALVTYRSAQELKSELKELGVSDYYYKVVHPLIPLMLELQHNGIRVDTEKMFQMRMEEEFKYHRCLTELKACLGFDVNPNSPKQLKTILYDLLELPEQTKDGKLRTDELALKTLAAATPDNPIFNLVLKARRARKMYSTYLDLEMVRKGRMHTSYNIGGSIKDVSSGRVTSAPETGRLSSSRSIVFNSGANLQNITRGRTRTIYLAEPGQVLFEADLSQAEARVVAYVANERRMIECFEQGLDVHKMNALWIEEVRSGKKIELREVTKEQRQFAKTHVHAFNYDEGPIQFAKRAGVSVSDGRQIQARYFQEYPNIKLYHFNIQAQLRKNRTLPTLLGWKRTFFSRMDETTFRSAYSYIPQGTVGGLLHVIFISVFKEVSRRGLKSIPVLQVHDSMVFSCPPTEVETLVDICNNANIDLYAEERTFRIPLEFKTGKNWGEMKEWKP